MDILKKLNKLDNIIAFYEADDEATHAGLLAIELERSNGVDCVDSEICHIVPSEIYEKLEFEASDEASNVAWYRVRG